jgi:hypothetical protein
VSRGALLLLATLAVVGCGPVAVSDNKAASVVAKIRYAWEPRGRVCFAILDSYSDGNRTVTSIAAVHDVACQR